MAAASVRLDANWREIARRAWSVRFWTLAVLFALAEAVLPLIWTDCPPPLRLTGAVLAFSLAGLASRFVAQRGL
jgi:hypothetical protein